jgi:hypothetical protein
VQYASSDYPTVISTNHGIVSELTLFHHEGRIVLHHLETLFMVEYGIPTLHYSSTATRHAIMLCEHLVLCNGLAYKFLSRMLKLLQFHSGSAPWDEQMVVDLLSEVTYLGELILISCGGRRGLVNDGDSLALDPLMDQVLSVHVVSLLPVL